MSRWARIAAAVLVLGAVTSAGRAPAAPVQDDESAAAIDLTGQTPSIDPGGRFDVAVRTSGLLPGAELEVVVHDRVRSRSELATSAEGDGLRAAVRTVTTPVDALPIASADGARQATVDLGATDAGPATTVPGVYPVELTATDPSGAEARLVTHLIVRPPTDSTSPPLAVGVLGRLEASVDSADELAAAAGLVEAIGSVPDVAVTLAARPELVDPLAGAAADQPGGALLAALQGVAGSTWLTLPFSRVSPDALAGAELPEELLHQLGHGTAILRERLTADPTETTWLAEPDLGAAGLALLPSSGVEHLLLSPDQVQPVSDGVLSVARPFRVVPPRGGRSDPATTAVEDAEIDGMVLDERVAARLEEDEEPALVANRVLAELASLWFEQERVARGAVLPIDLDVDAGAVRALLEGLRAPRLFDAVPVDEVFERAEPLVGPRGVPLERALAPEEGPSIDSSVARQVRPTRALRTSVEAMVGSDGALLDEVDRHLLQATSSTRDEDEQLEELAAARAAVDRFSSSITTPDEVTITLTAREGTVPLTIRNDTGVPVDVQIRLSSPKLELPDGDTLTLRLEETTTRRDIAVRTLASGSFPLEVELMSPDGNLAITSATYSVRSTAVSGVGVVLSAGAGLFLVVWWARHWREARRSAKLVDSPHPVHRSRADDG